MEGDLKYRGDSVILIMWMLALWLPEDHMHGDDLHVCCVSKGLPQHCVDGNIASCQSGYAQAGAP